MSPPSEDLRDPPPTRRESVTETRHGTEVADPYRWLEGDGEAVRAWTDAQNEYADALLDTPTRDRLRPRMAARAEVAEYGPVEAAGGRYFRTVRAPDDDHARLVVRESPGEDADGGTVLADPNEWPANGNENAPTRSLAWFLPAPDGERVAYGVTEGGDEQVDVHVVTVPDAAEVAVLDECGRVYRGLLGFDAVSPGMVAWDWDGDADQWSLCYVATGRPEDGAQLEKRLRRWRFDGREETLLECGDEDVWPTVRTDPASGTLAVGFAETGSSGVDWHVWDDRNGERGLRPVLADTDAETFAVFRDGDAYLQTDREAPRKRVLRCPVARFREGDLDLAECETVLPEREAVLRSFAVTGDRLVAHYLDDAYSRLAVYDRVGGHVRDLDLPDLASVSHLRSDPDAEQVFYRAESFHEPPTTYRADPETGDRRELARVDAAVPDDLVVRQEFAESSDGTEVPLFVCHRADVELDGENPAVLHGYGGFGSSRPPSFDRFRVPFLEDGGVYAQVCARGGGEYGEAWHEAATLADKQRTFDDFLAAGELLVEAGYAHPDRLAVTGRSNGGLSVGAVLTQRPDRWAAAHCAVPLLDMLRYHWFGIGGAWTTEYGDPEEPEAFDYLRAYSPYHSVEAGDEYPPVLLTTGDEDTRVHPCHARKMAARLQNEADGGPFVLRTRTDAGHGVGESASTEVRKAVEKWTFLYDALGMGE